MSRAPEAVRKKAEAADAFLSRGNTGSPEATPTPTASQETPNANRETPAQPTSQTAQPQAEQPSAQPSNPQPTEANTDWKAKHDVLQGKYNAEVPRLHSQVRELKEQLTALGGGQDVQALKQEVQQLRQELTQKQQQQQAAPANPEVLRKLRSDYGEELVDGLLSVMKQELSPLQQRIDNVDRTTAKTASETRMTKLSSMLREQGVDFDSLNNDDGFNNWLDLEDGYSGKPRRDLLNHAFNRGELVRVARFFTDYAQASDSNAPSPQPQVTPQEPQINVPVQPTAPSNNAAPDGVGGDVPDLATATANWTRFWDNKRNRKYTPEEAARLEEKLFNDLARAQKLQT